MREGMLRHLVVVFLLVILVSGCRPAGRAYSYLQYHNLRIGITRTTMTIDTGDSSSDARKFMDNASYAGLYNLGGISVRYPAGCEATAREVARAFSDTANFVSRNLGIDWSFDLEIRLVRIPDRIRGLHYEVNLKRSRRIVFPVFLNERGEVRADWAPGRPLMR